MTWKRAGWIEFCMWPFAEVVPPARDVRNLPLSVHPPARHCRDKVKPSNPFNTRGANDRFVRRCRT
jgi:hypothetical protein